MYLVKGQLYNSQDSSKIAVDLNVSTAGIVSFSNPRLPSFNISDVTISPRVGNTVRYLDLPNGFQFESDDNNTIDAISEKFNPSRLHQIIHKLEAAKEFVVVSVFVLFVVGWLFVEYGIPKIAREVAMALPEETSTYLGQGIMETLDEEWFKPSELDEQEQAIIQEKFRQMSDMLGYTNTELLFRSSYIGANAFALPNGQIIMTDELVELAENKDEIYSVLLHEIGHVHHRHTLRKLIEGFSMTFLVMAVSGDVSAGSTMIASAPFFIIQATYSQDMELEADDYSLQHMSANDIEPEAFASILTKLQLSHTTTYRNCMLEGDPTSNRIQECLAKASEIEDLSDQDSFGYLSSHPSTEERLSKFKNER